jgi:Tfp pilus assembly protein PilF
LIAAGEKDGAREMLQRALLIDPQFEPATKLLEELKTAEKPADSKKPAESGAKKSVR